MSKVESLTPDQIDFAIHKFAEWVNKMDDLGRSHNACDIGHSALLRRLLSGKPMLEKAPPKMMSYPCYALAEGEEVLVGWTDGDVRPAHPAFGENRVSVGQCCDWEWVEENKILRHIPTGDLYNYYEKTTYPLAVAVGKPEDHPFTGKFLKKIC